MTLIILISLAIIFPPCSSCSGNECGSKIFKEPMPNEAMKGRVIRSVEVPHKGSCRVMCYMEPNCVSINVGPSEGGKHKCELNNATDENQFPLSLEDRPTYTFLAIDENPCSSSLCLNNGTCQAGFTSKGFRCVCHGGYKGSNCNDVHMSCVEIYQAGERRDGVHAIKPGSLSAFHVFCDQTKIGGGWTVFQKRKDGSVDFYLNWSDYKIGFGDLHGEFWLGLDIIHQLTLGNNMVLRVDLEDFYGNAAYAEYNMFGVMSESDNYMLILGDYSGTAGDSFAFHHGQPFTTQDRDNDNHGSANCASVYHGAWWYKGCHRSNLNGLYVLGDHSLYADGVNWYSWRGFYHSLKRTEMKIRSVDF